MNEGMADTCKVGLMLIQPVVQNYAWGKVGKNSTVAKLLAKDEGFKLDPEGTYAELWMGTHPKGPAKIKGCSELDGKLLHQHLQDNPQLVGQPTLQMFGVKELPFLFKVLSINKSLSIQAHPAKDHARILHQTMPDKYPDPNHKPEMAIALTRFEALCGFRPVPEILEFLNEVPELLSIVGQKAVDHLISSFHRCNGNDPESVSIALKRCFLSVMNCESELVSQNLKALVERIEKCHEKKISTNEFLGKLFLRIYKQFPGDVGCFVIYFLNYMVLEPFQSIFLGPNLPHAYLSGDCVECMACSDNVVRAGLTPKFKDVDTLISMLDYRQRQVAENLFLPESHPTDSNVTRYNPPVNDFAVDLIRVAPCSEYKMETLPSASILLVLEGVALAKSTRGAEGDVKALNVEKGSVLFAGANEGVILDSITSELLMFRAYCKPLCEK